MREKKRFFVKLLVTVFLALPFAVFPQPIDMNAVNAREDLYEGVNAYHFGYFGKAVQSFEEALRLTPDNPDIKMWLARAYFRLGFEDTALTVWKDLLKAGKTDPLLEYIIHVVELRRGLGRELSSPDLFVVNYELDATLPESRLFKRPSGVVSLPNGDFFIVGYGSNEILSLNGNSMLQLRFRGNVESLDHPFDILPVDNVFFVSEFEGNVITKYDKDFIKLSSFGGRGIGDGKLLGPQYLALDEERFLYVTDWGNRRVCKFDLDGNFILSFAAAAAGYPYQRLEPTGIAIARDRVYVSDQFTRQIVVFDTSGNYLNAFGSGALANPEGLVFFDDRTLLVADGEKIMAFDLKHEVWKVWSDLTGKAKRLVDVALTPNGDILAADFDGNKVFFISEASSLYSGFFVQVDRVDSRNFPEILIDLAVEDVLGKPVVGLSSRNLFITESNVPVEKVSVALANTAARPLSVVILVEDSPELDAFDKELGLCIENIRSVLGQNTRIKIVFAREVAAVEADFGSYDRNRIEKLIREKGKRNWKFDRGLKTAVSELLPERGRKAVVFLGSGTMRDSVFGLYSLQEVTAYLRNNGVRFYPVYIGAPQKNRESEYIMRETGGKSYIYFDPEGVRNLFREISNTKSSAYVIRYTSPSQSDFGRAYIPLEVQVSLYKKSGRDESGYYAPLVNK